MSEPQNTEQTILEAARRVFARKGLEGARMQEIADEAGINKALLHYYFRSKEKLFELIFREVLGNFLGSVNQALNEDLPFFDKIRIFIDRYINMVMENPFIPGFIITEIHRDPERVIGLMPANQIPFDLFSRQVEIEAGKGTIRQVDPRELITNMIGLCIFPFIARPLLTQILFGGDSDEFRSFMESRKSQVTAMIIQSLSVNESSRL